MKPLISIATAGFCFSVTAAIALEECATIDNDLDRLACYDQASGRTPQSEVTIAPEGNWQVRKEKSDFEDTTDVFVSVDSSEPAQCGRFGTPKKATLMIRCMENTTSIYLAADCHMTSGHRGYGIIDYRIDDQPAGDRGFDASTNNRALGLWNGGESIPFIKKLIGSDRLLLRFTPFNENKTTVDFKTTGLEEAIAPLRKECNW